MCGWMRQWRSCSEPLYVRLKQFVLRSKVVGTDDTPVKVLDRKLPHARKGRIWPYVGDRDHRSGSLRLHADARTRRTGEFLKSYRGYVQADAYSAYDSFFTKPERGLIEVACWAHARRHFRDALESDRARMGAVLAMIGQLYGVEKMAREGGLCGEELLVLREQGARPVLDRLHGYLQQIQEQVLPKSQAGQAAAYALKNWTALTRYCDDADLSIDNNAAERALRGIAIGPQQLDIFRQRPRWANGSRAAELHRIVRSGDGRSVRLVS